jgi:hypothetical protein
MDKLYNMTTIVMLLGGTYVVWVLIILSIDRYFKERRRG